MALLEVKDLNKSFGGIHAVSDCTFSIEQGSITGLIGPNGAGKTTAFNLISGVLKPDSGKIWFDGKRIDKLQPHKITRMGMSRTFQITRNLEDMTVLENLVVQSPVHGITGLFGKSITPWEQEKAMELLDFLGITHLAYEETRNLSYGQKKLMDFAAMLMADPKLVLLDEPAGGVNPALLDAREPFLCLQCHEGHRVNERSGAPVTQEQAADFFTRCTDCHSSIHGSDVPSISGEGRYTR